MREKIFWDLIAKKYSKDKIKDIKGYHHSLDLTKKELKKTHKVLEFGCGTGSTALKLSSEVKVYEGSDISSKMIEIANSKAKKKQVTNVKFNCATLFDKNLKKGSYDVIMGFNIMHLVDDREKVMKRVYELLKPKGIFISKTPCLGESGFMKVIGFIVQVLIGPIRAFTLKEYKNSLLRTGFKIKKEKIYKEEPPRIYSITQKV